MTTAKMKIQKKIKIKPNDKLQNPYTNEMYAYDMKCARLSLNS